MDPYQSEAAEWGLRCYVESVAELLGIGPESTYCELNCPASAYLALAERHHSYPGRELALVWDEVYGWAAAVETASGEDLLVLGYLGAEIVPLPERVAGFVVRLLGDHAPTPGDPPALPDCPDLINRLARYARPAPG